MRTGLLIVIDFISLVFFYIASLNNKITSRFPCLPIQKQCGGIESARANINLRPYTHRPKKKSKSQTKRADRNIDAFFKIPVLTKRLAIIDLTPQGKIVQGYSDVIAQFEEPLVC